MSRFDRKKFRNARRRSLMTQIDLSRALGRGDNYVSRIENGHRDIALDDYLKACKILGITSRDCVTTSKDEDVDAG